MTKTRVWQFEGTGGPDLLHLTNHELAPPGPGEALVRIETIGLNRADLLYLAGYYFGPPPNPSFIGQEAVGEIVELGPAYEGETPAGGYEPVVGDRVGLLVGRVDYGGMGTYRTAAVYPQNSLLPLPRNLSVVEGAGFWLATLTAMGGLRAGKICPETAPGKKVLVTAASSGVGVMTLQIARAMGATTLAATTSAEKADRIGDIADDVIVVSGADSLIECVAEITGGSGVDLAFDPVGFDYAQALMATAAVDGQVVVYGLLAGTEAPLDLRSMIFKDLGVHGYTVHRLLRDPKGLDEVISAAVELAESGKLRPLIAGEYPFEEAPAALEAMARNEHFGKIVLEVAGS